MKALTHIYTGDGKGKTTAAIGLSIRAAGAGLRVLFTQFLKTSNSSELKILKNIENIDVFVPDKSFGFIKYMSKEKLEEARAYYNNYFNNIINKLNDKYDLLIMDEFMAAYNYNMIDKSSALDFIENKSYSLELVLTGRNPDEKLKEISDYYSEIKAVKHPYNKGIEARQGIEF